MPVHAEPAVLRLLDHPRRREILRLAWERERTASDLHRAFPDVTFGAVSQHLRQLERAGALRCRCAGRQRWYRAQPEAIGPLAPYLEALWDDALYRLKLLAELEERRRGPRPRSPRADGERTQPQGQPPRRRRTER